MRVEGEASRVFAFGTAAGDYLAETLKLGYWKSALMFGGAIALITFAWKYLRLNPILAFWLAYILTRPRRRRVLRRPWR